MRQRGIETRAPAERFLCFHWRRACLPLPVLLRDVTGLKPSQGGFPFRWLLSWKTLKVTYHLHNVGAVQHRFYGFARNHLKNSILSENVQPSSRGAGVSSSSVLQELG